MGAHPRRLRAAVAELLDQELYKTGTHPDPTLLPHPRCRPGIEFVPLDIEPTDHITHPVARHSYAVQSELAVFERVLQGYRFSVPWAHHACARDGARYASFTHWAQPVRTDRTAGNGVLPRATRCGGPCLRGHRHTPLVRRWKRADGLFVDALLPIATTSPAVRLPRTIRRPATVGVPWCSCARCCRTSRWTSSTRAGPRQARQDRRYRLPPPHPAPDERFVHATASAAWYWSSPCPRGRWCSS